MVNIRSAIVAVILLLALASPAKGGPLNKYITTTQYVGGSLGLMEMQISEACIQAGVCIELGPWLPKGKHPKDTLGRAAIKAVGTSLVIFIIQKLKKDHPKLALAAGVGFVIFEGWLATNAYKHFNRGR